MFPSNKSSFGLPFSEPVPRSFDQLHAERIYLLGVLREENEKATEFLRRVPPLEETMAHTESLHLRRSAKKQLGWLKCRIKETASQENSILNRLGHLSYEIQAQEGWNQVQYERIQHSQALNAQQTLNNLMYRGMSLVALNPLSPEFQPQGHPVSYPWWIPQQPRLLYPTDAYPFPLINGIFTSESSDQTSSQEEHPRRQILAVSEQIAERKRRRRPSMIQRSSSMNSAEFDVLATNTALVSMPLQKRHSDAGIPITDRAWEDISVE